jgi:hypothetical protein
VPCILATVVAVAIACSARAGESDVRALLDGVGTIASPGVPGPLCVFGPEAMVVVAADNGQGTREAVVAAGTLKRGRVVAFGHTGYFDRDGLAAGDTARLLANAARWAGGGAGGAGAAGTKPATATRPAAGPRVAVHRLPAVMACLGGQGIAAKALDQAEWTRQLRDFDVLIADPTSLRTDADIAAVREFLQAGGGLVANGLGWGWLQLNPGKALLTDHPGNRLLAGAGIVWADGCLTSGKAGYAAPAEPPKLAHAAAALDALAAQADGSAKLRADQLAQAGAALARAARSLPPGDTLLLPRLAALADKYAASAVPTARKPLKADQALQRALLTWQLQQIAALPAEKVQAHPAAADFPGPVDAAAPRVERTVPIDMSVPDWHGTGLYAAPGEVVTVELPASAAAAVASARLRLRIGAHKYALWDKDSWSRCPDVLRVVKLDAPVTRVASPFGGLVYVDVPKGCTLGVVAVKVSGAVEAPYYLHGRTDPAEWRKTIRTRPAPWGELASDKVVLTVPSQYLRTLEDPAAVMDLWTRVLDACAELAARSPRRTRPERYVADVQLTAGYMHAGYPIMTHLDAAPRMVNAELMRTKGDWGLFHEMGHNHQSSDWTFAGTGEVTENLFTLYVMEKVCGRGTEAHDALSAASRRRMEQAYFAAGRPFEKWQADPFLGLLMYIQLKDAFGWEAYRKVFAEYRDLPPKDRPRDDGQKRDQWMVRFSRTVGRNLGPFFQAWGVPTSSEARASVAGLPAWMPAGMPAASQPATAP